MKSILRIATLGLTAASLALPVGAFAQAGLPSGASAQDGLPSGNFVQQGLALGGTTQAALPAGDLGQQELPGDASRSTGEIVAVDPGQATFTLLERSGEQSTFLTGERTRYRGEGIESLEDLEPGMHALVIWVENQAGNPFALAVAARKAEDLPRLIRHVGEITGVVPGQGTFTMATRDGQELEFSTSERTRYRSRDGSVEDVHDLKRGMHALVGAVEREDGTLLALVVAVGNPEDRPDLDLRALGQVIAIEGRSFTLKTRDGEQLRLAVDQHTKFRGIDGFDELQVGMLAAVGAVETDSGLLAVWVGARERREERPQRDPQRDRESRPFGPADSPPEGGGSA